MYRAQRGDGRYCVCVCVSRGLTGLYRSSLSPCVPYLASPVLRSGSGRESLVVVCLYSVCLVVYVMSVLAVY